MVVKIYLVYADILSFLIKWYLETPNKLPPKLEIAFVKHYAPTVRLPLKIIQGNKSCCMTA